MGMHSTKFGGIEQFMIRLMEKNPSFQFVLVYERQPESSAFRDCVSTRGGQIAVMPLCGSAFLKSLPSFIRLCVRFRPEIIHFHFSDAWCLYALLARLLGVKNIFKTQHSCITRNMRQVSSFRELPLHSKILSMGKMGKRLLTRVLFVSHYVEEQYSRIYGKANNYTTVYMGVRPPSPCGRNIRKELDLKSNQRIVSSILFSNPLKGPEILLKAMEQIPGAILLLIGMDETNPYTHEMKELAQQLNIADRIKWIGITDRAADYLSITDVYVQPSRTEALSLAACEALSYGIPVVGSDVGGLPEASSLVFSNGDAADCARQVSRLLADRELYDELSSEARQRYEKNFSLERGTDTYSAIYRNTGK